MGSTNLRRRAFEIYISPLNPRPVSISLVSWKERVQRSAGSRPLRFRETAGGGSLRFAMDGAPGSVGLQTSGAE